MEWLNNFQLTTQAVRLFEENYSNSMITEKVDHGKLWVSKWATHWKISPAACLQNAKSLFPCSFKHCVTCHWHKCYTDVHQKHTVTYWRIDANCHNWVLICVTANFCSLPKVTNTKHIGQRWYNSHDQIAGEQALNGCNPITSYSTQHCT